jgi:broad specificity phosphatase PhoE
MVCKIYLIRHGETEFNATFRDKIGGRSNWAELNKKGIHQMQILGKRFKEEGIKFDLVFASPTIRAQQSARYCLEEMSETIYRTKIASEITELSQGDWEGESRDEKYGRKDVLEGLNKDCWNFIPGDKIKGESQSMIAKRVFEWIKKTAKDNPNATIAAFTHAHSIKFTLAKILNLDKKTAYKIPIHNSGYTIIEYENNKAICTVKNDSSHLKKAGIQIILGASEDPEMDLE